MDEKMKKPTTIDEYIADFPPDVQQLLQQFRAVIREAAPDAQEAIKYAIPTFVQQGNMISFAGYKKHISLYPVPGGTEAFQEELAPYKAAKSTAQFPINKPMPWPLIKQLVTFRVEEHLANAAAKGK